MDFGIVLFNSCPMSPAALGRAVEERGFESLFLPEHTHIPVGSRRTNGASARGYAVNYDPFVALSAAAAVTDRIRLGTAVCLVTQRDPIVTAKEVASLDLLSGGRFEFGVGPGWNREELANHGTEFRTRMRVMEERVRAMREIWAEEEAEYHGEFVDFDPVWSWPKPVQRPGPPVLVGGNSAAAVERVLEYGDGWMPQCGPLESVAQLGDLIGGLRSRAAEAERGYIPVTLFGVPSDRGLIGEFAGTGVDRLLFLVAGEEEGEVLRKLDEVAAAVASYSSSAVAG